MMWGARPIHGSGASEARPSVSGGGPIVKEVGAGWVRQAETEPSAAPRRALRSVPRTIFADKISASGR